MTTIHSYKGMENDVVQYLMISILKTNDPNVALTRGIKIFIDNNRIESNVSILILVNY